MGHGCTRIFTDFYLYLYTIRVHPRESVSYFKAFKVLLCDRAKYSFVSEIVYPLFLI
jgi:hypothetical protein